MDPVVEINSTNSITATSESIADLSSDEALGGIDMNALGAGEVVDEASLSKKERRMHKQAAAPIEGSTLFNPKFQCRMYESRFPEVDDLVMVNVRQIAEMGAYVHLLEYNSIEGMILLSELSRRRIRSIQKLIRVGRNEVVVVLRVDKEKGYIDLSKRRVTAEDIQKADDKFTKSKSVHSIMRHVAEKLDMSLEELYKTIGWPLYKKYGHAYDAFKVAISDPDGVFNSMPEQAPKYILDELLAVIRRRLTPQPVKIRADVEVTCFGYEGIDAVKAALKTGEDLSTEEVPIKIRLVAPPLYVMTTHSLDKGLGVDMLEKAISKIEEVIKKHGGGCTIKMKPRAVSESDELELAQLMARVEKENQEISGDEEFSDGEQP